MKKIKIRTIFGAHQIYQEIANYPPKEVEYIGIKKGTFKGKYYQSRKWNRTINNLLQALKMPRMVLLKPGDYDLIHSSRGIIPLNRKPWVMDIEQFTSFVGLDFDLMTKNKRVRRFIENRLASQYCKKILCHCESTRKCFFKYLDCSRFADKIKVLYPASHIIPIKKEKHVRIRFLSVLSCFELKGGIQLLKAFKKLENKYPNVELRVKADVPEHIKNKLGLRNVKYIPYHSQILPREELLKNLYSKCDVFVYPTMFDTFGYSIIDAFVAKMPVITTNFNAMPELVHNGKEGFVVNIPGYKWEKGIKNGFDYKELRDFKENKFVDDLFKIMERFVKNKNLISKMGKNSFARVSEGNLSVGERNEKLRKIYEEALK